MSDKQYKHKHARGAVPDAVLASDDMAATERATIEALRMERDMLNAECIALRERVAKLEGVGRRIVAFLDYKEANPCWEYTKLIHEWNRCEAELRALFEEESGAETTGDSDK